MALGKAALHGADNFFRERNDVVGGAGTHHVHDANDAVAFANHDHGVADVEGVVPDAGQGGERRAHAAERRAAQSHLRGGAGVIHAEDKDGRFAGMPGIAGVGVAALADGFRERFHHLLLGVAGVVFVEQGNVLGDKVDRIAHDAIFAAQLAAFGRFGAHDVHLYGLSHIRFRKQAAGIGEGKGGAAGDICCRGDVVQAHIVNFLFNAMADVPNAGYSRSAENEDDYDEG